MKILLLFLCLFLSGCGMSQADKDYLQKCVDSLVKSQINAPFKYALEEEIWVDAGLNPIKCQNLLYRDGQI